MFLIRSAFWLALIVMLLPSDPREQARLYQTASHALQQAATFCDRNQATCTKAEAYWMIFKDKLAVGARMATDLINERMSGPPVQTPTASTQPLPASDTLLPADRAPEWRNRVRRQL